MNTDFGFGISRAGSTPPPRKSPKSLRQILYECLELYLLEKKDEMYLDMTAMTETLQKKKPQFGRIKRDVFSSLVKQTYELYTDNNKQKEETGQVGDLDQKLPDRGESILSEEDDDDGGDTNSGSDDVTIVPYSMTMNRQIQQLYEPSAYATGFGRQLASPPPRFSHPGFPLGERLPQPSRTANRAPRPIHSCPTSTNFDYIPPNLVKQPSFPMPGISVVDLCTKTQQQKPPPAPTGSQMVNVEMVNAEQNKPGEQEEKVDRVPIRSIGTMNHTRYNFDDLTRSSQKPNRIPQINLNSKPRPRSRSPNLLDFNDPVSSHAEKEKVEKVVQKKVTPPEKGGSETGVELEFLEEVKTPKKQNQLGPLNEHQTPNKRASNEQPNSLVAGPSAKTNNKTSTQGQKRKAESSGSALEDFNNTPVKKARKDQFPILLDPGVSFEDFGGSEKVLEEISKLLLHLKHPEMYRSLGVVPPRGFILHGPPGCGKTLLANAIAGELRIPMIKMAAPELISGISGESESNIRELFDQAVAAAPCIIFIDEIDSITPKRETAQREMERRIVAQLLACIDELLRKQNGDQVLLIGATNRIDTIDIALRRAGRFDREICLGIPDIKAREKILRVICKGLKLEDEFNYEKLAQQTPGYVGADLQALVREAAVISVSEMLEEPNPIPPPLPQVIVKPEEIQNQIVDNSMDIYNDEDIEIVDEIILSQPKPKAQWLIDTAPLSQSQLLKFCLHITHFEKALKHVQPSSKREGFATVPDTTWNDIGALKDIRDELQVSILGPVKHMAEFQQLGLDTPAGVLLCGPPGCGKTLLAKAVANEAGINFISVKGPELLNMYVGESERAVRQCFQRAKNSSPCVIFFDELDALCPRRSDGGTDSGSSSRVVNQLLTEMDGMESRTGVFVMAATNRPDIVDPAILRPGRLDKVLFVNLPTELDRIDILKAVTKNGTKPTMGPDVDLSSIAKSCENFTGADLSSLVREASIASFREFVLDVPVPNENEVKDEEVVPKAKEVLKVYARHFEIGLGKTKPSVSCQDRQKYERMKETYSTSKSQ